jgi:hypothetical protein
MLQLAASHWKRLVLEENCAPEGWAGDATVKHDLTILLGLTEKTVVS